MATTKEAQALKDEKMLTPVPAPSEGLALDADYDEARPIPLLAERQREFQKAMQGHYVDTDETRVAFVQSLLVQGIIPFIPEGRPSPPPRPVPVRGEPVSETIIEERG